LVPRAFQVFAFDCRRLADFDVVGAEAALLVALALLIAVTLVIATVRLDELPTVALLLIWVSGAAGVVLVLAAVVEVGEVAHGVAPALNLGVLPFTEQQFVTAVARARSRLVVFGWDENAVSNVFFPVSDASSSTSTFDVVAEPDWSLADVASGGGGAAFGLGLARFVQVTVTV